MRQSNRQPGKTDGLLSTYLVLANCHNNERASTHDITVVKTCMYLKRIETCLTQESSNIRSSIVAACSHVHAFQNKLITQNEFSLPFREH